MAGTFDENIAKVIKQDDSAFPDYLDFDKLRKEGLQHIGQLAGKIWTDHNVHDPGITILEVLIYALMDLGYKTNLPFQDLITQQDKLQEEDNFLTPLQILTINPVTLLDYRKLLLECPGVCNVWIDPTTQEIDLAVTQWNNSLRCGSTFSNQIYDCNGQSVGDDFDDSIELNGLYKIYIEKEAGLENEDELKEKVEKLLSKHRNLCEALIDITILKPIEFGVCAKVEIATGFETDKVYKAILLAIKEFIQPQIKYYTLQELLEKGKTMDEIFAGRPYLPESFGFVDVEELEALERRTAIYLSDLYNVILNLEGVRKITSIRIDGGTTHNESSSEWVEGQEIGELEMPVFLLDKTCVDLYRADGLLNIDKSNIHASLPFFKKFQLSLNKLDTSVPSGKYRENLSHYYSIQNDFPVVYGIGEDGLPKNASLTRKTKALQLKGFLLFYDQLLANYTSQLSSLRSLFSLKPENGRTSEEKQTYFTQIPDTVPGIEKLLKFYEKNGNTASGSEMALPVANDENWQKALKQLQTDDRAVVNIKNYCGDQENGLDLFVFSSSTVRKTYIGQLKDSFSHEEYEASVYSDKHGYFFVLHPNLPSDLLLVGSKRYQNYGAAANEAGNVSFIAALAENYTLVTEKSENSDPDLHYFGLNYNPVSYLDLIGKIAENNDEYSERRQKMLDHLLARFGEDFTDYTLLKYRQKTAPEELRKSTLDDQSAYLNKFAEISRNRGKAFDYLQPSWNTTNVSGFEKRVSMLAGIKKHTRRNLCNIEVTPCYELQMKDEKGQVLLAGKRSYESEEALLDAAGQVLNSLKNPSGLERLKRITKNFNSNKAKRLFSEEASEENIIIFKYRHLQQLLNMDEEVVATGKNTRFGSADAAQKKKADFIENINDQNSKAEENELRLLPLPGQEHYLNINPFEVEITKHPYWKWQFKAPDSNEKILSEKTFPTEEEAWEDLIETAETGTYISKVSEVVSWKLRINEMVRLESSKLYRDEEEAKSFWEKMKALASEKENYSFDQIEDGKFRIYLKSNDTSIARSQAIDRETFDPESTIASCVATFSEEKLTPEYTNFSPAYAFQVPGKNSFPDLKSQHLYASKQAALKDLQKAYELGTSKKNYQEFGIEGEGNFGFRLQLEANLALAKPSQTYETEKESTRALNAALRFFKKEEPPVAFQKQPNKYTWALKGKLSDLVSSNEEFSSNPKARVNFEEALLKQAAEKEDVVFSGQLYHFKVDTQPFQFKFLYGKQADNNNFQPLFISKNSFTSKENTKTAYTQFVNELPQFSFKKVENEDFNFALYKKSEEKPVAVQYQKEDYQASLQEGEAVTNYFQTIYGAEGNVNSEFISGDLGEDQERLFEWKFYKKNDPLAINRYRCPKENDARDIKKLICDRIPPIDLRQCPAKEIVICPKKDPGKHHYQVCFRDKDGLEFRLISYVGYGSEEEAQKAWKQEWYGLLLLAKDPAEYGTEGKISLDEAYKPADDRACDEASFLAVIPSENKMELIEAGKDMVDFHTLMAHLFPIYEVEKDGKKSFKYKVVDPEEGLGHADCTEVSLEFPKEGFGSLIWLGTVLYSCYSEALKAYNHFYILAGISQNCQILCDRGQYYVALVEVLVESHCKYFSEAEAWDDAFASMDDNGEPYNGDACGDCRPGGVRSFLYAGDDSKNYIPVCKDGKWTFKVVESDYFLAEHTCSYNSEEQANQAMQKWEKALKDLDWKEYLEFISKNEPIPSEEETEINFLSAQIPDDEDEITKFCNLIFTIRDCLGDCSKTILTEEEVMEALQTCLDKEYKYDEGVNGFLENWGNDWNKLSDLINYFPIYLSENEQCYRIYWPDNDQEISEEGLQACGCEEKPMEEEKACGAKYLFLSSKCFKCCEEAIAAFMYLSQLIKNGGYILECTQSSDYGPYSFQILDPGKELGYHPQSYDSYQEVLDAIAVTKECLDNMGMHLVEHILLRPKTEKDCKEMEGNGSENELPENCLLPICPDYCCPIDWFPDMDKDDPCLGINQDVIYYLPGSDPYSFWATLVLPSWTEGFRTPDARKAFEQLLYKETPALVGLNILWLSPRDMCRFEDKFRNWLGWLQDPETNLCNPDDKHPNCHIVDCIKDLESESPCPSIPGAGGDCDCGDPVEESDPCCPPPESKGSIFWGHCPPQDNEPIPDDPELFLSEIRKENQDLDKPILAQIKKRREKYLKNLERLADDNLKKTKSYEQTLLFLSNNPTIESYLQLVDFFNQYSLRADTDQKLYLELLKNATWHLLDELVLKRPEGIPKKEMQELRERINILFDKGLSGKNIYKGWKSKSLNAMSYAKSMQQLEDLLKVNNGK